MLIVKTDETADPPSYSDATSGSPSETTDYVYYILRSPNARPSHSAFQLTAPTLGRVLLRAIPPPRTVAVLKRCIASLEGLPIAASVAVIVYVDEDEPQPLPDTKRIGDFGSPGRPCVVCMPTMVEEGPRAEHVGETGEENAGEYFYYRLYTTTGEDTSVHAFHANDPSLGRVSRGSIPTPYPFYQLNLEAEIGCSLLTASIAHIERKPNYASAEVYTSISAAEALPAHALLPSTAGRSKETAVVLVASEMCTPVPPGRPHAYPVPPFAPPTPGFGSTGIPGVPSPPLHASLVRPAWPLADWRTGLGRGRNFPPAQPWAVYEHSNAGPGFRAHALGQNIANNALDMAARWLGRGGPAANVDPAVHSRARPGGLGMKGMNLD